MNTSTAAHAPGSSPDDEEEHAASLSAEDDDHGDRILSIWSNDAEPPSIYDDGEPVAGVDFIAFPDDDEPEPSDDSAAPAEPAVRYPPAPCEVVVGQNDCLFSLAMRYGLTADRIWTSDGNTALRRNRKSNQLLPGDRVAIPAIDRRSVEAATARRHPFRRLGTPCRFEARLLAFGKPRQNLRYTLDVDGQLRHGSTDADGVLREPIPAGARCGTLYLHLGEGRSDEVHELQFGAMDPVDTVTGLQKRLNNLGFFCAGEQGQIGPSTRDALRRFQRSAGLNESGELDAATRSALESRHAS